MIRFACPKCAKVLSVHESLAGKQGRCPGCGESCKVPMESSIPIAEPPLSSIPTVEPLPPLNLPAKTGDAVLDALPSVKRGVFATGLATTDIAKKTSVLTIAAVVVSGRTVASKTKDWMAARRDARNDWRFCAMRLLPKRHTMPNLPNELRRPRI